MMFDDASDF
jgi:hypothetical protein